MESSWASRPISGRSTVGRLVGAVRSSSARERCAGIVTGAVGARHLSS